LIYWSRGLINNVWREGPVDGFLEIFVNGATR